MILSQSQQQRQTISATMQQSLQLLQLPMLSLGEYLSEMALENPMIEIEEQSPHMLNGAVNVQKEDISWKNDFSGDAFKNKRVTRNNEEMSSLEFADEATKSETFTEHLLNQLTQDKRLPRRYLSLCCFLVESLDSRGYLDEPIELLAAAMETSVEDMLQALYVVQSLTPTGVGARTLKECLILQLAQSRDFNKYTLKIVNECLPLLAKNNITSIAKKLNLRKENTQNYCNVIRRLNPIPSRGFPGASVSNYVVPEAVVNFSDDSFIVRYNSYALPKIYINQEYERMLNSSDGEVRDYLKKNYAQARKIIQDLENRESTLTRVIQYVLSVQKDYLLGKRDAPAPLMIRDVSEKLLLHPSTISRTVKEKYIIFNGKPILLKDLFAVPADNSGTLSKRMILEQMKRLIDAEDEANPLTDDGISQGLEAMGITISRRTVAAYRIELGIPAAFGRHKRNN